VVAEATLDYDGPVYETVFIFEFRDGRISKETAYWSEAFDPPAWRAEWVEEF
jgi:ketosteroid isomerase-like protein